MNKQDSIYCDLYKFLVSVGDMPQDMIHKLDSNKLEQYLYIFDILKDDFPNKPDLAKTSFGIFKFQYDGCIDCGFYVLIKYDESFKVYFQNDVVLILKELIKIRKENSDLVDSNLYEAYIEAILDDNVGIYDGKKVIVQTIGNIEYYK
jgi:hypothetical protein